MRKVMIFDDDPDIIELCSLILKDQGYETCGCTDCRDILNKITREQPQLILMDKCIPDDGGIEAILQLKNNESTSHIPIILFSGSEDVEESAEQAHADYFLKKPFDLSEFENLVAAAISRQ